MEQSVPAKRQADLQKQLGWSKAKANAVWHGQQYTQTLVDELAPWLNARPYELLIPPEHAMAIRRLRQEAARIVSDARSLEETPPRSRTGTNG